MSQGEDDALPGKKDRGPGSMRQEEDTRIALSSIGFKDQSQMLVRARDAPQGGMMRARCVSHGSRCSTSGKHQSRQGQDKGKQQGKRATDGDHVSCPFSGYRAPTHENGRRLAPCRGQHGTRRVSHALLLPRAVVPVFCSAQPRQHTGTDITLYRHRETKSRIRRACQVRVLSRHCAQVIHDSGRLVQHACQEVGGSLGR